MKTTIAMGVAGLVAAGMACGSAVNLTEDYRNAGAGPFSETAGRSAWMQEHQSPDGGVARSCASCHGTDITQAGRHIKTGKPIEAMALSVNSRRLTDPKKVEKWFRRNCRWTLGRECTPQEKGDFIRFMSNQ
jgi:mono/diheme cytochrome c family protein